MSVRDRFKDAPWVTNESVVVGGAGGIGSWLTLFLARIGYSVTLYDDDIFETHNMGGQFVDNASIGEYKTSAIQQLVNNFGGDSISTMSEKFTTDSYAHSFMFSAFDNMQARKDMFQVWFDYNSSVNNGKALFIDGRLTLEQLQIFCVSPNYTKEYREKHLFDDSEVEDTACTMKQTSHTAAMIAGLMTGFFTNHITNLVHNNKARTVPFYYEYFLPLNLHSNEPI